MSFSSANTLTHAITHIHLPTVRVLYFTVLSTACCVLWQSSLAALPSVLHLNFSTCNSSLHCWGITMYTFSKERLKEHIIVVVHTESEKVENHRGSNMRATPKVLSGEEVVMC